MLRPLHHRGDPGDVAAARNVDDGRTRRTGVRLAPVGIFAYERAEVFGKTPPFLDQRQQDSLIPELPEW